MDELTFLRERFACYYRENAPDLPPRFGRREWGFMFFGGGYMVRHMAFRTTSDLIAFLRRKVPAHAYYSTAYYKDPSASRMSEKGWLGADLIFDLDSDHLPGAETMTFEEMLSAVKAEMGKLLDEFILGDLGIDEKDVRLAFSGGRGYHLHVAHPGVLGLSSSARKEIIDYITGRGINLDLLLHRIVIDARRSGRFTREKVTYRLPPLEHPGWGGRITRAVIAELDRIAALPRREALADLMAIEGIGRKSAEAVFDRLRGDWRDDLRQGIVDIFPTRFPLKTFVAAVVERGRLSAMGEADEPVTTDIKRLIRLPGTLHGKTGLRVVGLTIDRFREFDPLVDAIAFGDEEVEVVLTSDFSVSLGGENFDIPAGAATVPEYLAVFLLARRMATLPCNG